MLACTAGRPQWPGRVGSPAGSAGGSPASRFGCQREGTSVGSIWTPSGEHSIPDDDPRRSGAGAVGRSGGAAGAQYEAEGFGPGPGEAVSAEEVAAIRQIHAQIRSTPAVDVIANHAVQLFELALVYLGVATPPDEQGRVPYPDLPQAGVAIDAMQMLVDGFGTRWGEHEETLRDGLAQIQMLYVQVADQLGDSPDA